MIVKNEEHVIERALRSALSWMDMAVIVDTGSTDKTKEIIKRVAYEMKKPCHLYDRPWVDFGHNRTEALELGKKHANWLWVLDADDSIEGIVPPPLNILENDGVAGFTMTIKEGACEYIRGQIFNMKYDWKYVGVLHEYASCKTPNALILPFPSSTYMVGRREGSRNHDPNKYIKDALVLQKHLEVTEDKSRTLFYLAQSYRDAGMNDLAIHYYKKRVKQGGWIQETWQAMYQLTRLYAQRKDYVEMEYWGQKAFALLPNRSENIFVLTRAFRENSQIFKAWEYYLKGHCISKPNDQPLFLENNIYEREFDYERTILAYYVHPHKHAENMKFIINFINKHHGGYGTLLNMRFYQQVVKQVCEPKTLPFRIENTDYIPSSTSIIPIDDGYLLNIRHVNYRLQPDNHYPAMENGNLVLGGIIRTKNVALRVNKDFEPISDLKEMEIKFPQTCDTGVMGIEDLRVFKSSEGKTMFTGTSLQYSTDPGNYRIVSGVYNEETSELIDAVSYKSPYDAKCEKNWIPLNEKRYIYNWKPFQIGEVEGNTLKIVQKQETPNLFEYIRGSTNLVEYDDYYWCITHIAYYLVPREYAHLFVKINKKTMNIEAYSIPFSFVRAGIEYTLGMVIEDHIAKVLVSVQDSNPKLVSIDMREISQQMIKMD